MGGTRSVCARVCLCVCVCARARVCVCVQIGISPCKQLEVYREKAVKMKDTHPLSSITYLFLQTHTHMHTCTHTHFLSISPSLCLSHVLVQIYCPLCDQLPRPSVSQRRGGNTVKQSHITTALLITGGPRRVTAMLATRINACILRDACLSTPLISTYTHTDWFNAGCQLYRRLKRNVYTHSHKHRAMEI